MKCIITEIKGIVRTADDIAEQMVKGGLAKYVNKADWKRAGRKYLTKSDIKNCTENDS
jgi:hypothetical protein